MAYHIKIEAFEGPFDLLFHLIEKNQIDLYDIPINHITDQYIDYIRAMEHFDLDVASEFLLMAATLLEIKSKLLLPVESPENQQLEFEEADPRHELVRKLIEYKKYKEAAHYFKENEERYAKLFYKPKEEIIYEPASKDQPLLEDLEMSDLLAALEGVLTKKAFPRSNRTLMQQLQRDDFTIANQIKYLLEALDLKKIIYFEGLFLEMTSRNQIITTFLALLELIKLKQILVKQDLCFTEIVIQKRIMNETEVR